MPTSIMQKNYSNCPLKKRPIIHIVREELLKEEPSENDLEPENLSTKPEDLSKTGKYPVIQLAQPLKTEVRTPSPLPIVEPVATPTIQERRNHPISPITIPTQPITPPSPAYTPPSYYPPLKSEPINLNSNSNESLTYTSPTNWHKPIIAPTPTYQNYLYPNYHHIPVGYENYGAMYHHVSPTRSEQLSPYNNSNRESSLSPPSQYHHLHHHHQSNYLLSSPRGNSISPPIPMPYSRHNNVIKPDLHYQNTQHRYLPYPMSHHHHHHHQPQFMMPIDPSSLSPTSSHTSYNSMISSRRSLSPLSTSTSSTPEDLSNSTPTNNSILLEKSNNIQPIMKSAVKKESSDKIVNSGNNNSAPRYQCPDCGKSYSTYSGLSKHQQFHCPAAVGNQVKKSFSCKYCEKVYVSLGALKMHIRTHTLPCKCHTCGKAFSRPWLLQGHIRTHTGEKPFSCQHCHRAFADRSNLRAHLQTHSDVKKYSCTTCSKTFSRMSLLTKHNDGGCPGLLGNNNNPNTLSQNINSPQPKDIAVY